MKKNLSHPSVSIIQPCNKLRDFPRRQKDDGVRGMTFNFRRSSRISEKFQRFRRFSAVLLLVYSNGRCLGVRILSVLFWYFTQTLRVRKASDSRLQKCDESRINNCFDG